MKASQKKTVQLLAVSILSIFLILTLVYLHRRFSFEKELDYFTINTKQNDTLSIGIIGDSWIADGQLDDLVHQNLIQAGVQNRVLSSGKHGAMSKRIYQNLYGHNEQSKSSKFIIEEKPRYVIVIAGVNDAVGQVGGNFYAHHIEKIVNTLIRYEIQPVLLELPEFGIIEAEARIGRIRSFRNRIFANFTNKGQIDNIKTYRQTLVKKLNSSQIMDEVIYVSFEGICDDYDNCLDLYKDPMHLSSKGNKILALTISDAILSDLNRQKN